MDQLAASKWPIFRFYGIIIYRGKADNNKIGIYVSISNMEVQLFF